MRQPTTSRAPKWCTIAAGIIVITTGIGAITIGITATDGGAKLIERPVPQGAGRLHVAPRG
jgi:hypothetical protein